MRPRARPWRHPGRSPALRVEVESRRAARAAATAPLAWRPGKRPQEAGGRLPCRGAEQRGTDPSPSPPLLHELGAGLLMALWTKST